MKVKNMNHSSRRTRNLIRKTFAEMLSEKKEIDKITVSELVARADIHRGTFYAHYDDIYAVAEDFENELIDQFFSTNPLLYAGDYDSFIDEMFAYLKENDAIYKMLCRSNDIMFASVKLTSLCSAKFLEILNGDPRIVDKRHLDLEINVFVDGIFCEYVKYCRGFSRTTIDELYAYAKFWVHRFIASHQGNEF